MSPVIMILEDPSGLGTLAPLAKSTIPELRRHLNNLDSSLNLKLNDNQDALWLERTSWEMMRSEWEAFQKRTKAECLQDLQPVLLRQFQIANLMQYSGLLAHMTWDSELTLKEVVIEVDPRYQSPPDSSGVVDVPVDTVSTNIFRALRNLAV